jgi:hypothetical protein
MDSLRLAQMIHQLYQVSDAEERSRVENELKNYGKSFINEFSLCIYRVR